MNINKEKILFAILAGGESKRFGGGFKTFTRISHTTILDEIIKTLKIFSNDIIINANNLLIQLLNFSHGVNGPMLE